MYNYVIISVDTKTFEVVFHGMWTHEEDALLQFENDRLELGGKMIDSTHFTVKHLIGRHDIMFQLIEYSNK